MRVGQMVYVLFSILSLVLFSSLFLLYLYINLFDLEKWQYQI